MCTKLSVNVIFEVVTCRNKAVFWFATQSRTDRSHMCERACELHVKGVNTESVNIIRV